MSSDKPIFIDFDEAGPEGLVGLGGRPTVAVLLQAYRRGIFPWPMPGLPLSWFSPDPRAILEFKDLKISRSLSRLLKKSWFTPTVNQDFDLVIEKCAEVHGRKHEGTWLTPELIAGYKALHRAGHALCVAVWTPNESDSSAPDLAGGIYGTYTGKYFSAESMFYLETGASKIALVKLVEHLKTLNLTWMDIQMLTPHLEKMGAKEIPRKRFLRMISGEE